MDEPSPIEAVDWHVDDAVLRLEHGRVSGSGGVNRLIGEYDLDGATLVFGPLATTMMAGPPEQMEREQEILSLLARVTHWSLEDEELVLAGDDGAVLLRLRAERAPS